MLKLIQNFLNSVFNEYLTPGPNNMISDTNHPVLSKLSPKFAEKVMDFLDAARDNGLNVDACMGMRTFAEQDALYAKGRSKPGKIITKAKGGQSWHNYGLAVDIVFKVNGQWSWDEAHPWSKLGVIGQQHGLEWGGAWKGFKDRPHFQYTGGLSIRDAIALRAEGGIERVWQEVNKG